MKLWFLPFVREGLMPMAAGAGRARVHIALQLEAAGRTPRDVGRTLPLLGPADVVGLDLRQVLRVAPAAGTRDAEPEFFPAVEFDAPDLPWAYSPIVPDGTRVLPWLVLIVIEAADGVTLTAGVQGQSPWVLRLPTEVARRELPDLSDSWAWAHAQVASAAASGIADALAHHPDRTLSRLLAPRRLYPFRPYHACVVPAFLSGRVAGLGGDPSANPTIVTGQEPAWSASDVPGELPVYYTWSFRTGEAGDFESLAQRLHAAPLDATIPPTPLRLSLPAGDGTLAVDWEPPLRVPGSAPSRPRRPAGATNQVKSALRPGTASRPILGPAYFGAPWTTDTPLTPVADWSPELNLTPALRAVAGLGADAVRAEQDALVAAASDQLDALRSAQREGRRRQLALTFVNRVKGRLAVAPQKEVARVFAPIAAASQREASNVGAYSAAGRRMARKTWVAAQIPALLPITAVPLADEGLERLPIPIPDVGRLPDLGQLPDLEQLPLLVEAIEYRPAIVRAPVSELPPPVAPVDPVTIPTGAFVPRFARPISEPLSERHPELMLPGASALTPDGVLLVESNDAFVEACLVGANQELNYELLWRGLPADPRATAFRRFWPHAGGGEDIDDIATWVAASSIGSHIKVKASMVLLVRSELVRRYPTVVVAAVPAEWNDDGARSPVKDAARMLLPAFRGRIGADVLYAGFTSPSIVDAIGKPAPSAATPGWYFLFSENPGDPRFGLDPVGNATPPTRTTLSWSHLTLPQDARYATVPSLPAVEDAFFTPGSATAANVASLVRQRPFRAFLHASLLVRLPD